MSHYTDEKTPFIDDPSALRAPAPETAETPPPSDVPSRCQAKSWRRRLAWRLLFWSAIMMFFFGGNEEAKKGVRSDKWTNDDEYAVNEHIVGKVITPFKFSNYSSYDPHKNRTGPALVSALAEPLVVSHSAAHHFLKVIGPQSIGEINFVAANKTEDDLVFTVRAIWKEEDAHWGAKELHKHVEGGVIEDKESGALGLGILTEEPHHCKHKDSREAHHPHSPHRPRHRRRYLTFNVLVEVPHKFSAKHFSIRGGVFPVVFKDLHHASFGDLHVELGVGAVVAHDLHVTKANITNSVGAIIGNISTSDALHLHTPVGPIATNVTLLPSSKDVLGGGERYTVNLVSQVGAIGVNIVSPIPEKATLDLVAHTDLGPVAVALPAEGYEGEFLLESEVGRVNLDVQEAQGKVVVVKEVKGRWFGGKTSGSVKYDGQKKHAEGSVKVISEVGSVALRV